MTAYEEYEFGPSQEVLAVFPTTPQSLWAHQVFEFTEALRQEMTRFDNADDAVIDEVGNGYMDGHYDAAEQLRNRFFEIFDVSETPAV